MAVLIKFPVLFQIKTKEKKGNPLRAIPEKNSLPQQGGVPPQMVQQLTATTGKAQFIYL